MRAEPITIDRAERIAQDRMYENRAEWEKAFLLVLNERALPISCVWLDPYMGTFQVYGKEALGFMLTRDLPDEARIIYP